MKEVYIIDKNNEVLAVTSNKKLALKIKKKFQGECCSCSRRFCKSLLKPAYHIAFDFNGKICKLFKYPSNDYSPYCSDGKPYIQEANYIHMNIVANNVGQAIVIAKNLFNEYLTEESHSKSEVTV